MPSNDRSGDRNSDRNSDRNGDRDDVTVLQPVRGPLPAAGEVATRVQGQFVTAVAVQKPRSLPAVQRRIEEEATLAGESFYYGWAAGGERIEGPSVKLAMAAVRCWGNCSVELLPVQEAHDAWIFTAAFVDYETGFTLQRQFRQAKNWQVHGKLDAARKEDIRFQIGQSKAIRNVVLNALPIGLIDRALDVARDGARAKLQQYVEKIDKARGKGKGIVQAVDLVLKGLAKHGVKEEAVLRKLEIAERKAIDLDRLVALRGDLAALDGGEARAEELYPPTRAEGLAGRIADKAGDKAGGAEKPPEPCAKPEVDEHGQPIWAEDVAREAGSLFDNEPAKRMPD